VSDEGVRRGFDAVLLVGFHAKAGNQDAILAHTWITSFLDVRVNGQSVPEPSLNTWLAGAFGVPVVMLSGDDHVIREARLMTHPQVSSPKRGTVSFTCEDYPTAYATLHSILMEVYERDIENLVDVVASPDEYERPGLDDLIGGHPLTERHPVH
jgi:D-aminopeptidase